MPRRILLVPHLTTDELYARYRQACELVERSRWHFLWLLAQGMTATRPEGTGLGHSRVGTVRPSRREGTAEPPTKPRKPSRRLSPAQRTVYKGRPSWNHQ